MIDCIKEQAIACSFILLFLVFCSDGYQGTKAAGFEENFV